MASSPLRAPVLILLSLLSLAVRPAEFKRTLDDPSTVPFSFKGSNDDHYVKTENGQTWRIVPSEADPEHSFFFYNVDSEATQWDDPRFPGASGKMSIEVHQGKIVKKKMHYAFDADGKVLEREEIISETKTDTDNILKAEEKDQKAQVKKRKAQEKDRKAQEKDLKAQEKDLKGGSLAAATGASMSVTQSLVVMIPFMLFLAGIAGRIYYLHAYYPELLFPTKTRRERRQKGSAFKPQKARGKMSQDGKGGRSANS